MAESQTGGILFIKHITILGWFFFMYLYVWLQRAPETDHNGPERSCTLRASPTRPPTPPQNPVIITGQRALTRPPPHPTPSFSSSSSSSFLLVRCASRDSLLLSTSLSARLSNQILRVRKPSKRIPCGRTPPLSVLLRLHSFMTQDR